MYSYDALISFSFSSAFFRRRWLAANRSGCHTLTKSLYAWFTSSCEAPGLSPNISMHRLILSGSCFFSALLSPPLLFTVTTIGPCKDRKNSMIKKIIIPIRILLILLSGSDNSLNCIYNDCLHTLLKLHLLLTLSSSTLLNRSSSMGIFFSTSIKRDCISLMLPAEVFSRSVRFPGSTLKFRGRNEFPLYILFTSDSLRRKTEEDE